MKIKPAGKYSGPEEEREIQQRWEQENVYEKVKRMRSTGPLWYFLDGPPYASGSIHLGTAWNKIIKDTVLRYRTMRGYNVRRQPGWDCHGLPIEVKVEELLGIGSKKEIEEKIGIGRFVEECRFWALKHVKTMSEEFKRLGIWMDWDKPYLTLTDDYIECAWWTLKRAHEKNLLRKALRVIHWCPRCETALAEHEVRGEYQDRSDPSVYLRFRLKGEKNRYLLVWTTTPWTLPADLAVCVHPEFAYVEIEVAGERYILAEGLLEKVTTELGWEYRVVDRKKGAELEGLEYEHPMLEEVPKQREFKHMVILGEHVTLEEGTGCVHTAPGHGEEDFEVGIRYNLPPFCPVDGRGRFTGEAGRYAGLYVKDADEMILSDLQRKGVLVKRGTIVHSYPHCWRCHTPLLFRATEQWFLCSSLLKPLLLQKNEEVNWFPAWVKERYVNGVESVGDWCLSRQRYWGIPIPLWVCGRCGKELFIESRRELREKGAEPRSLHRPDVDTIVLRCECGGEMRRVPDVLDVWFDSSIAAWASLNYPAGTSQLWPWPSEFITEGEDQVTKWFYAQQVSSMAAFGELPYRSVLMHGFALDEHGRKMSKSLGNVIEPLEVAEKYGADALRFYVLFSNPPWEDLKFSMRGVMEARGLLNTFWNVHVFATTYMSLDSFDPETVGEEIQRHLRKEDLWILSRLQNLIEEVTSALEKYELHLAARALRNFIQEDLSRWYIKLIRRRTWIETEDPTKTAAYFTLYKILLTLSKLLAPFTPHLTEQIYRDLGGGDSVHMCDWPAPDKGVIHTELEEAMGLVRKLVEAGISARQDAGVKLRWPVRTVIIESEPAILDKIRPLEDILKTMLNCREVVLCRPGEKPLPPKASSCECPEGRVVVDCELSDELKAEALARELVRRLQLMRRELSLKMEERVDAEACVGEESLKLVSLMENYIKQEVRIQNLRLSTSPQWTGVRREFEVEGEKWVLTIIPHQQSRA